MNPKVDQYINNIEQLWQREVVTKLRVLVHKADPNIEESIKWGTPAFDHKGPVCWLFCAKEWVHFSFTQGALLDDDDNLFEEDENSTTSKAKRTIKLRSGHAVPEKAIIALVKQAVTNNLVGNKINFGIPKPGKRSFDVPRRYESVLKDNKLVEEYSSRPYYQQKGYIQWIEEAKQPQTQKRRIDTMIRELKNNQYMPPRRNRSQDS